MVRRVKFQPKTRPAMLEGVKRYNKSEKGKATRQKWLEVWKRENPDWMKNYMKQRRISAKVMGYCSRCCGYPKMKNKSLCKRCYEYQKLKKERLLQYGQRVY